MLEQEVVSERDLRGKSDRVRLDVHRDLEDTLEQLRIANMNNDTKDKDLKVGLNFDDILIIWQGTKNWNQSTPPQHWRVQGSPWSFHWNYAPTPEPRERGICPKVR